MMSTKFILHHNLMMSRAVEIECHTNAFHCAWWSIIRGVMRISLSKPARRRAGRSSSSRRFSKASCVYIFSFISSVFLVFSSSITPSHAASTITQLTFYQQRVLEEAQRLGLSPEDVRKVREENEI